MSSLKTVIPLSIYIHIPWCIKKCPYCDFNSHRIQGELQEHAYISALMNDLTQDLARLPQEIHSRPIQSIFIGGGTPSLFSPQSLNRLLDYLLAQFNPTPNVEITLEANPGTAEQRRFKAYRQLGINRLSIGIQSFQDDKLTSLGRIHNSQEAIHAIELAQQAGFDHINIDLMHGLPQQTPDDALYDLQSAIKFNPTHLSWYQLTIEPNTHYYKYPPHIPNESTLWEIEQQGKAFLTQAQYQQYEISAYCKPNYQCQHNLNYWLFGDYLGLGAGAHSKITDTELAQVIRFRKTKQPNNYLNSQKPFLAECQIISKKELIFEFFLNVLRLYQEIPLKLLLARTGCDPSHIQKTLQGASEANFIHFNDQSLIVTAHGHRYLNDLIALFLPNGS